MSRTLKNTIDCVLENALVHKSRLKLKEVAKFGFHGSLPYHERERERRVKGREKMRRCEGGCFHG